ncbi:MAG: SdrD B-like domain-containing protein, partial [Candidatus Omnitrophica bacterium]|nr:SdrD B-like domain-containing protein [Candidatus Omnitrophota bacterium]
MQIRNRVPVLICFAAACILFMAACPQAFANLLGNYSFEEEIGNGTAANWDSTNGARRVTPGDGVYPVGFTVPPADRNFALFISTQAQFTFQTFNTVKPGDLVTFTGQALSQIPAGAGGQGGQLRIEYRKLDESTGNTELISDTTSPLITTLSAPFAGAWTTFTAQGVAPAGTELVVFTLREIGLDGNVLFDNMNAEINPAKLSVIASKNVVEIGEPVLIQARMRNASAIPYNNVSMFVKIPEGFDAIDKSARRDDKDVQVRQGSLIVDVGTIAPGQICDVGFIMIATSAVRVGHAYDIEVVLNNGNDLSETSSVQLMVQNDPIFDEGTIIGKVFNDANQNGVQDKGEPGVPWVRLVTEEGIVVITDEDGKYHIPGVKPGRHLVKIDGHTLPEGTKFITEETFLVKTTQGIMNKANFAILLPPSTIPEEFQKDLSVMVTQGLDYSRPNLDIAMEPEIVKVGLGVLEKDVVFRMTTNYSEYVKKWHLEIRDPMGREVWTGFGVSAPPPEVTWQGFTEEGVLIKPGLYSYQFKVDGKDGTEDWTPLHFFRVISKQASWDEVSKAVEIPTVGDFNIFADGKQSIPLVAKPTLRIQGKTKPENTIKINNYPVDVNPRSGKFQTEVYTSAGDKEVVVTATNPEGETTTYRQSVKVKDSMFFMVALGEEQMGINFSDGRLESTGNDWQYK